MVNVGAGALPQLLGNLDTEGKYTVPRGVIETLRNLRKPPAVLPNQIIKTEYEMYESTPRLDGRAFRYLVKDNEMFMVEGIERLGGLSVESVLTPLGDFVEGDDITPDFTEIVKIRTVKGQQREQQSRQNERIARRFVSAVNKIGEKETDLKIKKTFVKIEDELKDMKRFIRPGKSDYYQAQMEIISKHGGDVSGIKKLCDEYQGKIDVKNLKWTAALKLPKNIGDITGRVGTDAPENIGGIAPPRRQVFEKYYALRSPVIERFLFSEDEIIDSENGKEQETFFVVDEKDNSNGSHQGKNKLIKHSAAGIQKNTAADNLDTIFPVPGKTGGMDTGQERTEQKTKAVAAAEENQRI